MIGWWGAAAAAVIALIVLGFCTYEVLWRVRRLRRDIATLTGLAPEVADVVRRLELVSGRVSSRSAGGR